MYEEVMQTTWPGKRNLVPLSYPQIGLDAGEHIVGHNIPEVGGATK